MPIPQHYSPPVENVVVIRRPRQCPTCRGRGVVGPSLDDLVSRAPEEQPEPRDCPTCDGRGHA